MRRLCAFLIAGWIGSAAAAQPVCPGVRFDIRTPPLTSEPYVVLGLGGLAGPWLLDYGSTRTTVASGIWPDADAGGAVLLGGFTFPGETGDVRSFPVGWAASPRIGVGAQHGTVGTDLLGVVTAEFHFEDAGDRYVVISSGACAPDRSRLRDFVRVSQVGFFGLRRGSTLLPNVPIIPIELQERSVDRTRPRPPSPKSVARTWAQLDTGYADTYWPYAVDINEAYLAELKRNVPSLTLAGLLPVSGCGGEDSLREVYLAPGWRLNVLAEGRAIPFDSFSFVVKPSATACGGIGPMSVPAAQLGSSYLRAFGTTIVMPHTSELWIRTP